MTDFIAAVITWAIFFVIGYLIGGLLIGGLWGALVVMAFSGLGLWFGAVVFDGRQHNRG